DPALETGSRLRRIELEPDRPAQPQIEFAAREPRRALLRLRQITPRSLDAARQQALEMQHARLDESGTFLAVGHGNLRALDRFATAARVTGSHVFLEGYFSSRVVPFKRPAYLRPPAVNMMSSPRTLPCSA